MKNIKEALLEGCSVLVLGWKYCLRATLELRKIFIILFLKASVTGNLFHDNKIQLK